MTTLFMLVLLTLAIEMIFISLFVGGVGFLMLSITLFIGAFIGLIKIKRKQNNPTKDVEGWVLDEGVELNNPDTARTFKNIVLHHRAIRLGTLSTGSPGGGKTESVSLGLIKYFNDNGHGWAYLCGKGQKDVYQKFIAAGVKIDKFFSISKEYPSNSINLMQSCDTDSLVNRLMQTLIEDSGNAFYANEQKQVLMRVVPLICGLGYRVNLPDLFVVLTHEKAGAEVISHAKEAKLDHSVIALAEAWFKRDINERTAEIKGMLNMMLPLVIDPVLSERINNYNPDIVLEEDINSSKGLYFHLPYSEIAKQIAVMIIEEKAAVAAKRQLRGVDDYPEFHQVYDDWGKMVHGSFSAFTSRARSAKMPPHFTFQSPAQLDEISATFRNEIDDTVCIKIVMRVMSPKTARLAKELIGVYETQDMSRSVTEQRGDAYNIMSSDVTRIDEDMLYSLDTGQAVISTLEYENGVKCGRGLYKARFPLVNTDGWEEVQLHAPEVKKEEVFKCLDLWSRYYGAGEPIPDLSPEKEEKKPPVKKKAAKKPPSTKPEKNEETPPSNPDGATPKSGLTTDELGLFD